MISWKRLALTIAFALAVGGGIYACPMSQEQARRRAASHATVLPPPPPPLPRPWRWATEPEWVVSEVTRQLLSWTALAGGEGAHGTQIRVHRTDNSLDTPGVFEVAMDTSEGSRKFTIQPSTHVWDPEAYLDLAKSLAVVETPPPVSAPAGQIDELLLAADTASLRRADRMLFSEMSRRPRDPGLHEEAALLWASHALRESDGEVGDERAFLNGVTAHLALARVFRGGAPAGADGEFAAAALDALLFRQVEAMASLDALEARGASPAWTAALRLRITRDPRFVSKATKPARLEMVEALRAIRRSQSCRVAIEKAGTWHLPRAADWTRSVASLPGCPEPEASDLTAGYLELQAKDAAALIGTEPGDLAAILSALRAAAEDNAPSRPSSVVPRQVLADAGQRHIVSAFTLVLDSLMRLAQPQEVRRFNLATETLRDGLPQRALLDMALESATRMRPRDYSPPQEICDRIARLIADRPDLVPPTWWHRTRKCQTNNLLGMVKTRDWDAQVITPGTGRKGVGPWKTGPIASGPAIEEACRRAPWAPWLAVQLLQTKFRGEPPTAAVRAAYGKLLEYDIEAMKGAVYWIYDDDDEVARLSERICDTDAEQCSSYASLVASLGRTDTAERMWKRAMASAQDLISLSVNLQWYVELLLDRGETAEALRVARRAADVYSAGGLEALGYAYERLGRLEEAAQEYALITERYDDMASENQFYIRYGVRHSDDRFREKRDRALAEVFPRGLQRKSLADFQAAGVHGGGVFLGGPNLTRGLRRLGLSLGDLVVGVDGFAVESQAQLDAILTFINEPSIHVVFFRQGKGYQEVQGQYRRTKYGPVGG
jgi:tetratricopeptide (TPR) repeat protein